MIRRRELGQSGKSWDSSGCLNSRVISPTPRAARRPSFPSEAALANEIASQVSSVAHVIQLAVALVFLLAGVGALLAVLTNRLARVVDRFHALERELAENPSSDYREKVQTTIIRWRAGPG